MQAHSSRLFAYRDEVGMPTYQAQPAGPHARAENLANQEIPLFLGLRARKLRRG